MLAATAVCNEFGLRFQGGTPQGRGSRDPLAAYLAPKGSVGPCHRLSRASAPCRCSTLPSRAQCIVGRDAPKHEKKKPLRSLQTHGVMTCNISPVTSRAVTDARRCDTAPCDTRHSAGEPCTGVFTGGGPAALCWVGAVGTLGPLSCHPHCSVFSD